MYTPAEAAQMTTPCRLQVPTTSASYGVKEKTYTDAQGLVYVNWKSFGGTETTSNNMLMIEDTAQLVTWYRPDLRSGCRLVRLTDNAVYEVIGEPENFEERGKLMRLKVSRVKGEG